MVKAIKKIFVQCCVIFSFLMLVLSASIAIIGIEQGFGIDHLVIFALFILCFIISCSNVIYSLPKLPGGLKYLLHLIAVLASSAVFLKVVNGLRGKTILIAVVIIAIVHAIIFIAANAIKKSRTKVEKYESVYKKEN